MRRPLEHRDQGIFVAEGEKVVRRLLESDFSVVSVLLPQKWVAEYEPLLRARAGKGYSSLRHREAFPGKARGLFHVPRRTGGRQDSLHARSLAEILALSPNRDLFVAIEGLSNAENVGAVVRNCAAFHCTGLIVSETSSSPFLRRAVRNSMGTIFDLPVIETDHLVETLRELHSKGVRLIAAHPHVNGRTLSQADFTSDSCLVFGSEGAGIAPAVLELVDDAVAIPMPPKVDSLNVGAAAAIFLYEANRQRGKT